MPNTNVRYVPDPLRRLEVDPAPHEQERDHPAATSTHCADQPVRDSAEPRRKMKRLPATSTIALEPRQGGSYRNSREERAQPGASTSRVGGRAATLDVAVRDPERRKGVAKV